MRYLSKLAFAAALTVTCAFVAGQAASPTPPAPAAATPPAGGQAKSAKPIDPTKLDAKGYIRQWIILAPINFGDKYNAEDIDKDQITDEAKLTPKEGDKQKVQSEEKEGNATTTKTVEKELTWKKQITDDFYFDINTLLNLDDSGNCGGYAVAYLDAPEEMKDISFSLCSNDNGKIFLNGKSIFKFVGSRGIDEDADTVKGLTLNKGINVVIFKVWNDSANWQGCIRLLDKNDKPVTNVTVKLSK